MRKFNYQVLLSALLIVGLLLSPLAPASFARSQNRPPAHGDAAYSQWLTQEVNHQLLLLPRYSIYDNLQYEVNGTEVTLSGQVWHDTLKSEAQGAVKRIEGVTKITNNIEILPLSPIDDQLRRAAYRSILGDPALEMYAVGSLQAIHIIVKNGHITLEGNVLNEGHKNLAGLKAQQVPGAFSVTNNLRIENSKTIKAS